MKTVSNILQVQVIKHGDGAQFFSKNKLFRVFVNKFIDSISIQKKFYFLRSMYLFVYKVKDKWLSDKM